MGIDGIGKGGTPGVSPASTEPGGPDPVDGAAATEAAAAPDGARASEALARLERGEIDPASYLDARAAAAVAHLEGRLPAAQLAVVRQTLREQLETDPVLVELVRRTTAGASAGHR